jgi:hypothetical protein
MSGGTSAVVPGNFLAHLIHLLSERGPSKYTSLFHRRAFNRALGSAHQQSLHELVPPVHWNIREMRNTPLIHEKVDLLGTRRQIDH